MALDAGTLVFELYPKGDPLGTPTGVLTEAFAKRITVEDNGFGSGSFEMSMLSSQYAWLEQGCYVLAYRDSTSGSMLGGFWLDSAGEVLLSPDEEGGLVARWGGRGPLGYLHDAVTWHVAYDGPGRNVRREVGEWRWQDAHPARVLRRMLREAQARGALSALSWDFNATNDSDGNAWSTENAEEYNIPIGMHYDDLASELRETGLYLRCDPDLSLHAWDAYDNDLSGSIGFTEGVDIREVADRERAERMTVSSILVEGENKRSDLRYRVANDAAILSELGRRREGFFRFTRTATRAVLDRVAARKLARWKLHRDGPTSLGVIDTTGQVALVDYTAGDTVSVTVADYDDEPVRIAAITCEEIEDGTYDVILELVDLGFDADTDQLSPSNPNDGSGTKPGDCTRCKFPPEPTEDYPVDDFEREVTEPGLTEGSSVGSFTKEGALVGGLTHGPAPESFLWWFAGGDEGAGSYIGAWYNPWTSRPPYTSCGGLDNAFTGNKSEEVWYSITMPAHPADMAGIKVTVGIVSVVSGYGQVGTFDVVVLDGTGLVSGPTSLRLGTRIATLAAGESTDVIIPAGLIPAEGNELWLGVRSTWQNAGIDDPEAFVCGFTWPYASYEALPDGNGNPWGGYSGKAGVNVPASPVWMTLASGESSIGDTLDPADTGAPWDGPHTWQDGGSTGSSTYEVTSGALTISSDTNGGHGFTLVGPGEDDAAEHGSWSDVRGSRHDVRFSVDAEGNIAKSGTRELEVTVVGQGYRGTVKVHLGDGDHAAGIEAIGANASQYVAKAVAANTEYVVALDLRADYVRAKFWGYGTLEPAAWDVEVPLGETDDTADQLILFGRVGNADSSQALSIHHLTGRRAGIPGQVIVNEFAGYAAGGENVIPVAHRFVPGSIRADVVGIGAPKLVEIPDPPRVRLDAPFTADSGLALRYIVAE